VSLFDGMSLLKKTGRGCYATFATMTAALGCDAANLSRSLKRLVEWGYLTEERQDDRRRKAYRVTFESEEGWRKRQHLPRNKLSKSPTSDQEIVGSVRTGNDGNLPAKSNHYTSLKELDSVETEELDSSEEARLVSRLPASGSDCASNVGGELARFERVLKAGVQIDLVGAYCWLDTIWGTIEEIGPNHRRALRLLEELEAIMTEEELQQCTMG